MDAVIVVFFFFQAEDGIRDVAVTGVQTCALPISNLIVVVPGIQAIDAPARLQPAAQPERTGGRRADDLGDRKSTRLNSSHGYISYAVFCLKKKKKNNDNHRYPWNVAYVDRHRQHS